MRLTRRIQRVVTLDDANFPLATLTTSGTTGQPKRLYFTRDDQELTIDFFHIGMSMFTDPGDRVSILLPGETPGIRQVTVQTQERVALHRSCPGGHQVCH